MLWAVDVYSKPSLPDREGRRISAEAQECGLGAVGTVHSARAFLFEGALQQSVIERIARELLVDSVVEEWIAYRIGQHADFEQGADLRAASGQDAASRFSASDGPISLIQVLRKPGVMDPVAQSCEQAVRNLGIDLHRVRTFRKYWVQIGRSPDAAGLLAQRVLANESIEQVVFGELALEHLGVGQPYRFERITVPLREMDEPALATLSREGQLYLSVPEMTTIRGYFRELDRDPTDAELETIAQTWSEHCSHKTLGGRIHYREFNGCGEPVREIAFDNLLKETIFAATQEVRGRLGPDRDWCVSVFKDNAGIVRFDGRNNVCFKVETHNHPSAIEPYGGANTGIGGVIRDVLGTGLGARPVANTDVFCFAPPDTPFDALPPGVLHPKRVLKGVVAGVRDYGNRMGIPTVNGAIYFDPRYLANPLVYCGTVGVIPVDRCEKQPHPGDLIVAAGGRTGRDGIHGATFSSAELTHESEDISGGAVQIGNAITEKMVLDVLLQARDRGLYSAVTDCGAGGFSSAVGEMGAEIGAELWLERAPLKYEGLSYTEIWISEAQERMVLAVAPDCWEELHRLCTSEDVEATVIGEFCATGRLVLKFHDEVVCDLSMDFLHHGRPAVVRDAVYRPRRLPSATKQSQATPVDCGESLKRILCALNVCSKEWVIRQYDHEVQGGSVVKPLVGAQCDGPSDAAVIRPELGSSRGVAIACGMNPHYGDLDPYWMAAGAIDEAVRNCVAVGADPERIALLDNFCWGNTDRPESLGSLVRAALACREIAVAYGTPFISGKDSLNNEYTYNAEAADPGIQGEQTQTIAIPSSLLISALGQVDDVNQCVTMDLKEPGNALYLIGATKSELGGSHYALVHGLEGGQVPTVDALPARELFGRIHQAIRGGLVRSCHDLSEGGLAVAAAEMAFAGGLGAEIDWRSIATCEQSDGREKTSGAFDDSSVEQVTFALFAESNSRFLCEVRPEHQSEFERCFQRDAATREPSLPAARIGHVTESPILLIRDSAKQRDVIREGIAALKKCWQQPLQW